ncbi:MAG TPA: right-handed parallel beta-helix repeat-containing protein [Xanthobacteraceae bacterium]|nr:right-handed parallel beta-helix repeat-containing protein [Xanthobacteraceae bacterium]
MAKSAFFSVLLGTLFVLGLAIAPAHAQATRTWISGVGDDANPCSRTAPCKTFAGAISKTTAGGEIDALDPGGFGGVTITKAITFDGGGGQVASILVAGTNGINISAGASDTIIIRNMRLNGILNAGSPGLTGIAINTAAKVVVEKCEIFGFQNAAIQVSVSSGTFALKVQETTLNNNGGGITSKPSGGATVNAVIERTHADGNTGGGVRVDGTGGGSSNVAITDSSLSNNGSNGLNAVSGPSGNVKVDLTRDVVANNASAALQSSNSTGGTSTVTVGQSMLSNNGTAWSIVSTGQLLSYGNNQVTGPVGTGPTAGGIQPQ